MHTHFRREDVFWRITFNWICTLPGRKECEWKKTSRAFLFFRLLFRFHTHTFWQLWLKEWCCKEKERGAKIKFAFLSSSHEECQLRVCNTSTNVNLFTRVFSYKKSIVFYNLYQNSVQAGYGGCILSLLAIPILLQPLFQYFRRMVSSSLNGTTLLSVQIIMLCHPSHPPPLWQERKEERRT